ncbi:flagellum site-determining protein YlxH [Halolactibacillus alkaliphilus]|uniref:Flagellum site-determining protein YlxH n=1 Tax=Halolactibacillus alkaliphilus TaxID=442899 RepID=A0A511WXW8_9BACI|nr:MinD/ParA family protein [Halolactibacillus alkaliphilus]GEN55797.1 flagellum site-determining protein YlxH [Halolactibacillus alkaliphilus]GGN64901.1 flagellum site-determining protein YlxH [Halolactibacillus alkaliphilus]SFO64733.1 flagellar biosynthesis protein FlhG [Halolactibacillus alkaliphilus]
MNDQAHQLRKQMNDTGKEAKTIAVISGKGGVGKSNITLNFALDLVERGKKVLIFDLDIGMGNIDILLGLQSQYSIVDMFNQHLPIEKVIETTTTGLSYITAGSGLTDLFQMNEEKINFFLMQFNEVLNRYDYIFFDMGAGATKESLFYILSADECFVVTTPEPTAMMDAYAMIKHVYHRNNELPFYLIMNRATSSKEGEIATERLKRVVLQFLNKECVALGQLPLDAVVSKSVTKQQPFIMSEPKSKVAKELHRLIDTYLNETDVDCVNSKQPRSFITKLKKLIRER